jgi:methionyl aminopeptidase
VTRGAKPVVKTEDEIALIRESSLLIGKTQAMLATHIRPGISTWELDQLVHDFIKDHGAYPGFLGYNDFPNSICASVNSAVVHGIPNNNALHEGDIVSVDIGVVKNGFWGDSAFTFAVGEIAPEVQNLLRITRECLDLAIQKAVAGNRIGDIGNAVQTHAEQHGYGVVRELVGHGVGINLHEAPEVPNYGRKGSGPVLQEGWVLAIEPMINLGTRNVKQMKDGWTIQTTDGKPSAHFEHTIVVRKNNAEVLSSFKEVDLVLNNNK